MEELNNARDESIVSRSVKHYNQGPKFSSSSSSNSVYEPRQRKIWANIELISKNSDGKSDMYKRSFYRQIYARSGANLDAFNASSKSLYKGLDCSNFICE